MTHNRPSSLSLAMTHSEQIPLNGKCSNQNLIHY
jgi:hypothetical protein